MPCYMESKIKSKMAKLELKMEMLELKLKYMEDSLLETIIRTRTITDEYEEIRVLSRSFSGTSLPEHPIISDATLNE